MKIILLATLLTITLLSVSACGSAQSAGTSSTESAGAADVNAIDMNSSDAYMCDWKYDTGKGNVITFHSIKAVRVITSSPQRKILSGIIHGK